MDVPAGFDPTLILVFNLIGTFVFGLSGGLAAVRARLDLVGVLVLAAVVGTAGGIVRDLFIGVPPATFRDSRYLAAVALAGLVAFFVRNRLERRRVRQGIQVLDAFGLGMFAVTGATKALGFGLGPVQSVILGVMTAVGGGLVRDLLVGEVPTVLREGLYAVPAAVGAALPVVAELVHSTSPVFPVVGFVGCVALRLLALRYDLNVPTDPTVPRLGRRSRRRHGPPEE